jgi:hypothetical protein
VLLVPGLASCALLVSFEDYGAPSTTSGNLFTISGTVTGLEERRATLLLTTAQGNVALDVGDGSFAFPSFLRDGAHWNLSVADTQTHTCTVAHGVGEIASASVRGVEVSCVSRDATLVDLRVSVGALFPSFAPAITDYTATFRGSNLFGGATMDVSAVPSNPGARITIAGKVQRDGPTTLPLVYGDNDVEVLVTAPDRRTSLTYKAVVGLVGADDPLTIPGTVSTVALWNSTLAVCSSEAGFGSSAVRTYQRDNTSWGTPRASIPEASSLALDGTTMLIGGASDGAHVFTWNGGSWVQTAVLAGGSRSVALAGDVAAIAGTAPSSPGPGPSQRVIVYARSGLTWSEQASFDFSSFSASDRTALALSGGTLAVGTAYEASDHSRPPNAVFIFALSGTTWAQQGYFETISFTAEGGFGTSIALSGNTLAVGAPERQRVYVYTRAGSTWSLESLVKPTTPSTLANFGTSVALSGDTLVVGSPLDPNDESGVGGRVSVLTRSSAVWTHQISLHAPVPAKGDFFGAALALGGGASLVVGGKGAVYGF